MSVADARGRPAQENTTFSGVRQSISHGFPDPLRAFSERAMKSWRCIDRHGAAAQRFDQVGLAAFVNPRSGCWPPLPGTRARLHCRPLAH
jgi:hypothetical protein